MLDFDEALRAFDASPHYEIFAYTVHIPLYVARRGISNDALIAYCKKASGGVWRRSVAAELYEANSANYPCDYVFGYTEDDETGDAVFSMDVCYRVIDGVKTPVKYSDGFFPPDKFDVYRVH